MTNIAKPTELLPCPFCGKEPVCAFSHEAGRWDVYEVECPDCQITKWSEHGFTRYAAKASAIAAWNHRSSAPQEPDEKQVVILSSVCGKHFDEDCYSCRSAKESNDYRVRTEVQEPVADDAESLARLFHETYERLAPQFSYETRKASAVPWEQVPENNRKLMIAVAGVVLDRLQAKAPETGEG